MTPPRVDVDSITSTTAVITWDPYTEGDVDIDMYRVTWESIDRNNIQQAFGEVMANGLSVLISGLQPNMRQLVRVKAINDFGAGDFSDEFEFLSG